MILAHRSTDHVDKHKQAGLVTSLPGVFLTCAVDPMHTTEGHDPNMLNEAISKKKIESKHKQ